MSEFRKDPLHNKWVLIVPERGKRPHAYFKEENKEENKICPFCEGNENMTPPEIDSFRNKGKKGTPGWNVRVFANKYPALTTEAKEKLNKDSSRDSAQGYGSHEIVVETPLHERDIYGMTQDEILLFLKMYRKRYIALKQDKKIKSIFIFKNHGRTAGASLSHSHSQIIALPMVPPFIKEAIKTSSNYKSCIYCALIEKASDEGRVLLRNESFIVIAPYASEFPYQLMVLPAEHKPHFEETSDKELTLLSGIFKEIFNKYKALLGNVPFNYFINTFPLRESIPENHWNIQIMPKLTVTAGFEKGTGITINPVPPETAVKELKKY